MWLCILVLLALTVILILVFRTFRKPKMERNKEPLPAAYSGFQPIDEQYQSALFNVSLLCRSTVSLAASPNPIRVFPSIEGRLIVACNTDRKEQSSGNYSYFKLNREGTVIDSLRLADDGYWAEFIDGFIIFTREQDAYYNTWPADGDTGRHTMLQLNADLSWNGEQISKVIGEARAHSPYSFFKSYVTNGTHIRQFFFLSGKSWKVLWQQTPGYTTISDGESAGRYRRDVFGSGGQDAYLPSTVALLYFYPQEKMSYAHVIGGGQGGFRKYDWRGTGFFSTSISGDTMEFCVPKLVVEKERFDNFRTRLYLVKEPGSAVQLFSPNFYIAPGGFALYASDAHVLYLITKHQGI